MSQQQQTKRHHFVPKAYLKAFCDAKGRLLVYRKDSPSTPLHVAPDATQFRRYYYSQPTPGGGWDNNSLETVFSNVETGWSETVARLGLREDVNDRLENIFMFMALQRARVPAMRDAAEAMMAQAVKDSMQVMLKSGRLPPPPPGLKLEDVQVAIDPHQSIHAMVRILEGTGELFGTVGLSAVHNGTGRPFLTSDNPVIWFDPTLPFEEQRPYTVDRDNGHVLLFFPVSPTVALMGSSAHKEIYGRHGLLHGDVPDVLWVDRMNAQVCRFAYEAVIASASGNEALIAEHADVSPVHEAVNIPTATGAATLHRMAFGPRSPKPKYG
jgi:hypothetical protein